MSISVITREPTAASEASLPMISRDHSSSLRTRSIAFQDFVEIHEALAGLEGSAFQSTTWLAAWYGTFGNQPDVECFLQLVESGQGQVLLAFPLVRRLIGKVRVLEHPDFGVSDYSAPLIMRAGLPQLPRGDALWKLLIPSLPDADVLHVARLAPVVAGMPNPLFGHPAAKRNRLSGWVLPLEDDWKTYVASLSARMREKLKKIDRKFDRIAGAERKEVTDVREALSVLKDLERLQCHRIEAKGLTYYLNQPRISAFYERLIENGLSDGSVQMTALMVNGQVVAANFAAISGDQLVYLRVANEFGEWSSHALGLVVTEFAIAQAQRKQIRLFDFGMGNYDYKRRFGAQEIPLQDVLLPLTWRGWPTALMWHIRSWASQSELLRRLFRRARADHPPCRTTSEPEP